MSLLTICQNAARKLNLPPPSVVIAATDPQALLLLQCAREECYHLASRHIWQKLLSEHTFTTVATASQSSATPIPTDFDRIVPDTMYNRTRKRRVWGPIDSAEWQRIQSSLVTRVDPAFRIRGGTIYITPTPTAGDTVAYEYVSTKWAAASGGTPAADWAADTDVQNIGTNAGITENVIRLGVVWRFRKAKRVEYGADFEDYERAVTDLIMNDGSRPTLSMDPSPRDRVPYPPQTPETLTGV